MAAFDQFRSTSSNGANGVLLDLLRWSLSEENPGTCFGCSLKLTDCKTDPNYFIRHKKESPNCPYVQSGKMQPEKKKATNHEDEHVLPKRAETTKSNSPLEVLPAFPTPRRREPDKNTIAHYKNETNRLFSFYNAALTFAVGVSISPKELAEAGLYYTGKNDIVQCPYCFGTLERWEKDDRPFNEHYRRYPQCSFVLEKLRNGDNVCSSSNVFSQQTAPKPRTLNPSKPLDVCKNRTGVSIHTLQLMDYSEEIITLALNSLSKDSKIRDFNTISVELLIEAIFENEDKGIVPTIPNSDITEVKANPAHGTNKINSEELATNPKSASVELEHTFVLDPSSSATETLLADDKIASNITDWESYQKRIIQLQLENTSLKEEELCGVCWENKIDTLFMPCGHLSFCEPCGRQVKLCPICRIRIKTKIRVSMR